MPSPFLTPGAVSQADGLALLHLRRDDTVPTILRAQDDENLGYKEGKVTNTRFGSYPHSTLIGKPWGSQIAASKVDTGSRGRKGKAPAKRKAEDLEASGTTTGADEADNSSPKQPIAAGSGFLHLIYPTPESWTLSLPHRTQVVYTPDYSYILHRLRARAGGTVIEAGAGSGSFTHAAVRAVFNGYPDETSATKRRRLGKVCSFEFHEQRSERMKEEITQHGLEGLVQVTHRDVYEDGFLLGDPKTGQSPKANAIFLDLPAPWLALKHLVRKPASGVESPLDPSSTVYLCTFSPCLEQAARTIKLMRQLGWLNISMVEVNHNLINVKRDRIGLDAEGVRGATVHPGTVDEAINKLVTDSNRARELRDSQNDATDGVSIESTAGKAKAREPIAPQSIAPAYDLGRLVHRTEPEIKQHTSYLVFALLPRDWSEEDEQRCREKWPSDKLDETFEKAGPKSRKQMKREFQAQRVREKQDEREKQEKEPETQEVMEKSEA
ncbi:tRNA (adenine(58)-N(1))-methyltransferase catalytic subunit trm61 [Penicillium capsulatum]|uniref:tRNA (adenine(58)-N(1))-methyltransferase catalytic subunit TRM61 n=1 Tax=Penicillium capsulatum TaxID=69766 RepID=A0A9W9IRU4_9EURO|nr:tRNA (adenine(58)-N(1))-methyltransferase catalytic subunit trm61 [Penicillium capsulatum]KAJ6130444.1 tRNA (adenine(58)-N(1))-methyltransferase catalytic subunit trm61 [Penicillium capsulatum]